jgi:hypothetical protein
LSNFFLLCKRKLFDSHSRPVSKVNYDHCAKAMYCSAPQFYVCNEQSYRYWVLQAVKMSCLAESAVNCTRPERINDPIKAMGFSAMFTWGKHCWHPIAVMGIVDTFGQGRSEMNLSQRIERWTILFFNHTFSKYCAMTWWQKWGEKEGERFFV